MKETFYITTPIYFTSGKLTIGHAYTTVAADTVARLKRMQGFDVMFLTGTDEHGLKVAEQAAAVGLTPKAYVDGLVTKIKELWTLMGITYDKFIRTTDDYHELTVQKIYQKLYDQGDIYKHSYEGLYCVPCESFWTDAQLKDGCCPDCGRAVSMAQEESYFFRLSKYADRLVEYYESHPDFLQPQSRVNEMLNNFIKPGLKDLCVSRSTFDWGVRLPFDDKHIAYVWIDALSNYITALGYLQEDDSATRFWPADVQLMAKEIVRFHAIIWPILLMALDLPLPKQIFAHGWLLLDGGKLSKSKSTGRNVVDPVILSERYGVDALRYFLMRDMPFGQDGEFSNEALINRINADLANDLGNLVSRTTAMADRYFGGTLPSGGVFEPIDCELKALADDVCASYETLMSGLQFPTALTEVWKLVGRANKYIDETMPWVLAKDEANSLRLLAVLKNLCEAIRVVTILITPVMPSASEKIFTLLGTAEAGRGWDARHYDSREGSCWSTTTGSPIFPRIDVEAEMAEIIKLLDTQDAVKAHPCMPEDKPAIEPPDTPTITIDDFFKVELRAAKILSAEPVDKSDKLYKIQVDLGWETRQVVSGIRQWYSTQDLVGRTVAVVANLAPAKLRGVESNGMLLAADDGNRAVVVFLDDSIAPGSKVR